VSAAERAGLDASDEPGVALLRELIDDLRLHPATLAAQVVQRWSDREGGESLKKLLEREEVITSAAVAAAELRGALGRLADLAGARRLEALEAKSRSENLDESELKEFQALIVKLGTRRTGGG
jgi:hypothetical protein